MYYMDASFVHFVFTILLQLCVVEESSIFGLWEPVGGGGWGWELTWTLNACIPQKLAARAVCWKGRFVLGCAPACLSGGIFWIECCGRHTCLLKLLL